MKIDLNVDVHHLTRVEGHGNIIVRVEDSKVQEARWDVVETPRFFEAMLRGKHFSAAGILTARICGICSIGHCLASIRASENAFGIVPSKPAQKLRLLAKHGETIQSHVLHVFFLAAPDFFNLPNVISLLEKENEVYDLARRMRLLTTHLVDTAMTRKASEESVPAAIRKAEAGDLKREVESALFDLVETVAPGVIGIPTVKPFMHRKVELVQIARRLKKIGNRICDVVAGRTTHPVSLQVGGIAHAPDKRVLSGLRDDLKRSVDDLLVTAEVLKSIQLPDFTRDTEFVSLKGTDEYPFIGGRLVSTDGVEKAESEYLAMTNEYLDPNNTSKWCKLSRESFAVGALSRLNNNFKLLRPEARKIAQQLGFEPVNHNPFMNNVAQVIETVHAVHDSIRLIDELLDMPLTDLMLPVEPRAGEGVGAVEVPRGILYHHYTYNKEGRIEAANCIIPTTQNNANIHLDLGELAKKYAKQGMSDAQLELLCSMLVRSYDPCISCSVH